MKKILLIYLFIISLVGIEKGITQEQKYHLEYSYTHKAYKGGFNSVSSHNTKIIALDDEGNEIGYSSTVSQTVFNYFGDHVLTDQGGVTLEAKPHRIMIDGGFGRSNPGVDDDDDSVEIGFSYYLPSEDIFSYQHTDDNSIHKFDVEIVVAPIIVQEIGDYDINTSHPYFLCPEDPMISNLDSFTFDGNTSVSWYFFAEQEDSLGLLEEVPGFNFVAASVSSLNIGFGVNYILDQMDDVGSVSYKEFIPSGNLRLRMFVRSSSLGKSFTIEDSAVDRVIEVCSPDLVGDIQVLNPDCYDETGGSFSFILDEEISDFQELFVTILGPDFDAENDAITNNFDSTNGEYLYETIEKTGGQTIFEWKKRSTAPLNGRYKILYQLLPSGQDPSSTDLTSLEGSDIFEIEVPNQLTFTTTLTDIKCNGATGSITIIVSGGSGIYEFQQNGGSWSSFVSGYTIPNLVAGSTHTIKVRDSNDCEAREDNGTVKITSDTFSSPTAVIISGIETNPKGNGLEDGSISTIVGGGAGSYTYLWYRVSGSTSTLLSGETNSSLTFVGSGNYKVIVKDANNCTKEATFTLTDPPLLVATINSGGTIACDGDSVTLSSSVSGGIESGSYDYQWKRNGASVSGGTGSSLVVSTSGSYTLEVTDDNNITKTSNTLTITKPSAVTFTASFGSNTSCNGGNNGTINLTASGGIGSYRYAYRTSSFGSTTPTVWQSFTGGNNHIIEGLSAGTYYIQVSNTNNCTGKSGTSKEVTINIGEPSVLEITLDTKESTSEATELDGSIKISVDGGTEGYSYSWVKSGTSGVYSTDKNISGLGVGTYTVTVSDANFSGATGYEGCQSTASYVVSTASPLVISEIDINNPITCNNGSNGELTISGNVSGGTPAYSYQWYKSNGSGYIILTGKTASTLSNAEAGDYRVMVTDSRSVTASKEIILNQPTPVTFSAVKNTDIKCDGEKGSIRLTASGGSGSFQYQNNGGSWITFTSGAILSNTIEGSSYVIKVRDSAGCIAQESGGDKEISISFPDYDIITFSGTVTPATGNGLSTGGVIIETPSGGFLSSGDNYSYDWSNGTTTQNLVNVPAGVYSLIVYDSNGCSSASVSFEVTEPEELTVSISETSSITCNGGNGRLTASGDGGVVGTGYKYTWYNSSDTQQGTGETLNALAGDYYVVITDNSTKINTTTSSVFTLNQPTPVTFTATKELDIKCDGETGSIRIDASGGSGTYQYAIIVGNFGSTLPDWEDFPTATPTVKIIPDLKEGTTYSVKVQDTAACIAQESGSDKEVSILFPDYDIITFSGTVTAATGNGEDNGSITIETPSGGFLSPGDNYSYEWSNGTTIQNLVDVPAGDYSLIVSDSNGCSSETKVFEVKEPKELTVNILETSSITCNGGNGRLTASGDGGVVGSGYSYTWYKVGNSSSIGTGTTLNRVAGDYYVVITDNSTKVNTTTSSVFTLNQPTPVTFSAAKEVEILCDGQKGSIKLTASGGSGSFQYQNNGGSWVSFTSGSSITGLAEGSLNKIKVRDTAACIAQLSGSDKEVSISFPSYAPITFTGIATAATGNGLLNGSIDVSGVLGGSGGYVYSWSNGAITQDITGLSAGDYSLIVSDSNGCSSASVSFEVTEPEELTVSISETSSIVCNAGTGELTASGDGGILGSGYSYTWYEVGNSSSIGTGTTLNRVAGDYYVVITDKSNPVNTTTSSVFKLEEPTPVTFSAVKNVDILCDGETGSIKLTASGGSGSFQYQNNGGSWVSFTSGFSITGLAEGSLNKIKVRDSKACVAQASGIDKELSISFPSYAPITFTGIATAATGNGLLNGSIDVSGVSGGSGGYTYSWSNGATTQDLTGLSAGDYSLIVSDSNGCNSASVSFEVTEPEELTVSISETNSIVCNAGTGELTASGDGGVVGSGYSYTWYEVGNSSSIGTGTILNRVVGDYYVVITDKSNPVNTTTSSVFKLEEPTPVTFSAVKNVDILCDGETGSIKLIASGGSGSFQYQNNGGSWVSFTSGSSITGLAEGSLNKVKVRDSKACVAQASGIDKELSISFPSYAPITFTGIATAATGNGLLNGSIDVSGVSGGSGGYTYSWSNGAITQDITGLLAGDYSLVVSDSNGCSSASVSFEVTEPEELTVSISETSSIVCNAGTGELTASGDGGILGSGYSYTWYKVGEPSSVGTGAILNTVAGNYYVVITDKSNPVNTTTSSSYILNEPTKVLFSASILNNVYCKGGSDGRINIAGINSDVGNYEYKYRDKSTGNTIQGWTGFTLTNSHIIEGLSSGSYIVEVRDGSGCTGYLSTGETSIELTIVEPEEELSIDLVTPTNPDEFEIANGSIVIDVSGGLPFDGTAGYNVTWTGDTNNTGVLSIIGDRITINNLLEGDYRVTIQNGAYGSSAITSNNTCEVTTGSIKLIEPEKLEVTVSIEEDIKCYGDIETIVLKANPEGGVQNTSYQYEWFQVNDVANPSAVTSLGIYTQIISQLSAGIYKVKITDDNGISVFSDNADLSGPTKITIDDSLVTQLTCYGVDSGVIEVSASGGTVSDTYRFVWDYETFTGEKSSLTTTTNVRTDLAPGKYTLTVKDDNNCTSDSQIFTIDALPVFDVSSVSLIRPSEGASDGSIHIEITGGEVPHSFQWYKKNTVTELFEEITRTSTEETGLEVGDYAVIITDAIGCVHREEYSLKNPGELIADIVETNSISCFDRSDGQLYVEAVGGSGGNTYTWYNALDNSEIGTNSQYLNNVSIGTYYVIVNDADGVTEQSPAYTIGQPTAVNLSSSSSVNLSCFESGDGSISLTANGGTGAYTYRVSQDGLGYGSNIAFTNSNSTVLENLVAGTYEIQIQDANGCYFEEENTKNIIIHSIEITQPNFLEISNATITDLTGFELSNGSIVTTIIGGTEPYTYVWTNALNEIQSSTTNSIANVSADIYTVNITDAQGCTTTGTYEVTQPDLLEVSISQEAFILCNADASADLQGNATGGSGGNIYTWYNSSDQEIGSSANIYNLVAGDYYIKVVDSNNNEATTPIFTVTEPTAVVASSSSVNLSCFESGDGSISLTANGGTGAYTYRVNQDGLGYGSNIAFTNSNSTVLENLVAGTYEIQIQDANGCYFEENDLPNTITIEVTQPNFLEISNNTITDLTGFELSNGSIVTTVIGGTEPYTYVWTNASNEIQSSTSNSIINISADIYTLNITDAQGCTTTGTYEVTQPDLLEISISQEAFILCNADASADLQGNATGGSGGNVYTWYNSSDQEIGSSANIYNLVAGDYYIKVVDSNNNEATTPVFTVTEPTAVVASSSSINLSCFESGDGSISLTANGGTGAYTYRVNQDGLGYGSRIAFINSNSTGLENLVAGTYEIQIQDANGCYFEENDLPNTITIEVTQPNFLEISNATVSDLTGFELSNGSIVTTVIGGTEPYTYVWTNASNEVQTSTSNSITNISADIYTVNITDAQGCTTTGTYEVTQPDLLEISISQEAFILCNADASADLQGNATGGSGGNVYTWYNSLDQEIGSSANIYNLVAGDYYIKVVDSNNNEATTPIFTVTEPTAVIASSSSVNLSCFESGDGSISLTGNGGTGAFTYRVNQDGLGYGSSIAFTSANTTTLENLVAGTYEIQIQDANSCYFEENDLPNTITIEVTQPNFLEISNATVSDLTGFELSNGSIVTTVIGGTEPYTYVWTNALNEVQTSTTNSITNISADIYTLNITDAQGCTTTGTYEVTQPDLLEISISQEAFILCNADASADLQGNATGGSGGNVYTWYNSLDQEIGSSANIYNLVAGDYYIKVVDSNNNEAITPIFTVNQPDVLATIIDATYTSCGTGNDWEITATVTGGTLPYSYNWSNGATTATINNVAAGNYFVVIEDLNGCRIVENYSVIVPEVLVVEETVKELYCASSCEGEISLTITGGIAPYNIEWNTGAITPIISDLCAGNYIVTITDQKGCEVVKEYTIEDPAVISVDLEEDKTLCSGQYHQLDISINDPDASYYWESDNGFTSTEATVSLTEGGVYTATVTTGTGCISTDSIEIKTSEAGINAQFLITSQAFAGEDIVLVNTSNPISEEIEWLFPDGVEVIATNGVDTITLRFEEAGAYEIILRSIQGRCYEDYTKTVIVGEPQDIPDIGDAEDPFIVDFNNYPNPTSGDFNVTIALKEEAMISLRLFSLISNVPVDTKMLNGQSDYDVDYDLNLPTGVYFLLLETSKETEIRKIVIE